MASTDDAPIRGHVSTAIRTARQVSKELKHVRMGQREASEYLFHMSDQVRVRSYISIFLSMNLMGAQNHRSV